MNVLATASRDDVNRIARVGTGHANWCTDRELITEVSESLLYVGDIQYGSVVADAIRHQISCKLQDGRRMRVTVTFE